MRPTHRAIAPFILALMTAGAPTLAQPATLPPPAAPPAGTAPAPYVPARGAWQTRRPSEVGMDDALIAAAVEWARGQETDWPRDFSKQSEIFGRPLGPVPTTRALTNGLILRRGYIIAEWGDTSAVDPTYSVAKSYLSTILGLTLGRAMIPSIDSRCAELIHDGGYDSDHNSKVTWAHHATQTSEWDGVMFGKGSTFIGHEEFGQAEMKPRELHEPGTYYEYNDVRVNRLSLSLLRLWQRPLPDVLKTEIMDPIGASDTWKWLAYDNATVEIDGRPMPSVSGGTRWGAGLWMSTRDHARFGLLILRRGEWDGKQIVSGSWVRAATLPHGTNPGYGYLWWLNSEERWKDVPRECFAAMGAGENTIWIDPKDDLVVVWRWHRGRADGKDAVGELTGRVVAAVKRD